MQVVPEWLDPASGRHERVQRMSRQLGLEFWGDRVLRAWLDGSAFSPNRRTHHPLPKRVADIVAEWISECVSINVTNWKSIGIPDSVANYQPECEPYSLPDRL